MPKSDAIPLQRNQVTHLDKIHAALRDTPRPAGNVKTYNQTCPEGYPPEALEVVQAIQSRPLLSGFEAVEVRAARKAAGNPFDFSDIASVSKKDFTIPGPASALPARLYTPASHSDSNMPALIFFHGGGYCLNDIENYDGMITQFAHDSGLLVVSVEYRLSPESPFPGPLMDAQHAFNWMHAHADDFGMDPSRMAIGGDSAGGNLATVVCVLNRDEGHPAPALQWLIYPSTIANNSSDSRERLADAPVIPKENLAWMHRQYISQEESNDCRFNVMATTDLSRLPPAFILTAGFDPLMDEGEAYAKRLRDEGVCVRHSCYTDMFHGFFNYGVLPQARAAVAESAAVISAALA